MSNQMDHERFSELLSGYVRDELSVDEKKAVTAHLETCSDCREELAGLRALVGGEVTKLDDFERRRIHAAVAEAIESRKERVDESSGVSTPPRPKQSLMARFAPTMGVAALLILLAVGAFTLGGRGSDDEAASGGSADSVQERDGLRQEDQETGGGGAESAPQAAPGTDSGDQGGFTDGTADRALRGPQPKFLIRESLLSVAKNQAKEGDLGGYVRRNVFDRYSDAYSVRDAVRSGDTALRLLSWEAPVELRRQVRDCGDRVRDVTHEPILPAYGTVTEFDARRSLLLGFVYTEAPHGKLSNYMLWAWPKGSCEETLGYTDGTVDR
ncbi:MAG TPA: zf-HC2 domain-containing protein [Actinomycetota bacterium]|nr:zf-HC2 domain-containing protein [Actinomycetota bacterium]